MAEVQSIRLSIPEYQELGLPKDGIAVNQPSLKPKNWHWWLLVALNIAFLLIGQSAAVLLGRFYYDQGGNSKWMATLVQTAAFPILLLPLFLFPSSQNPSTTSTDSAQPSIVTVVVVYLFLGILIAGDNMLYSVGLLYLSASTYALICASQLAFNAVFSFFINSQKFTALILNCIVLLTLSASLIAVRSDSAEPEGVSKGKYVLGFLCTLGASAAYSLILSLMQLSFQKVLKKQTFSIVLQMQIFTSLVATCACIVGLFASGEWKGLKEEMDQFGKGKVSYVMTLVWTAVSWQICSVGVVGLIFVASSLFSNVISTLALPLVPVAAVILLHDKMDGVKVVAMLLAIWGFASYLYQHYIDDSKLKAKQTNINEVTNGSMS
ncbi:PREDICTED: probable purine permease 11 [Nelumbo nucifera]|uniref:Probable purine permease n=2 Tax=Nelumbo nucifera TaxID=4432 RepID=A0A1U7Z9E2_NELNU|nr:PREDICTED: probable purine permease 11 [Nelumbo nucifera]